jgi:hypothetical protein
MIPLAAAKLNLPKSAQKGGNSNWK